MITIVETDQDMITFLQPQHKEARTVLIDHNPKVTLAYIIIQDVLDANVQHVQKIPRH